MNFLPDAAQMSACDAYTICTVGIPSMVLMERASLAIADRCEARAAACTEEPSRLLILCVCGSGNNGGDGAACARILRERGFHAEIALCGNPDRFSPEMQQQIGIAEQYGVPIRRGEQEIFEAIDRADILVDALFGIGLARTVSGKYAEIIEKMNSSRAYRIAADIPSGISADHGGIMGVCVHADETVTMQFVKRGMFLYPGAHCTGAITAAPIGILAGESFPDAAWEMTEEDLRERVPARDPAGNKGTFGKVLIAAGSPGVGGASYLASLAAFRTGCGMVKIVCPEENREILQTMLPEAMLAVYGNAEEAAEALQKEAAWADVIACGPGIGTGACGKALTEAVLSLTEKTVVLDADALNCLQGTPEKLSAHPRVVVTPHMGEMARLSGRSIAQLKEDPLRSASAFAKQFGCICVLKDARTCIGLPGGDIFINRRGSSGMATAGSGDVLTGIMAGLFARGCRYEEGPALACLVHGLAGERAAQRLGPSYMNATDLIEELRDVLRF